MVITTENKHLLRELKGIIYVIRNRANNKCYVGQTQGSFARRYKATWCNYTSNFYLKSSIKKYGQENFEIEIVENSIKEQKLLNTLEEKWALKLNSYYPTGYNFAPCGKNSKRKLSKEYIDSKRKSKLKSFTFKNIKTGEIINCNDLKLFCNNNNLCYSALLFSIKRKGKVHRDYCMIDTTPNDVKDAQYKTRHNLTPPYILWKDHIKYEFDCISDFVKNNDLYVTQLLKLLTGKILYYNGFTLKQEIKAEDHRLMLKKYEYIELIDRNGEIIKITDINEFRKKSY